MLVADEDNSETQKNGVSSRQNNSMDAPEKNDGTVKSNLWKRHNGGIREKRNENEKEKLKEDLQYNVEDILLGFFGDDEDADQSEMGKGTTPEPLYREPLYDLSRGRSKRKRRRSLAELEDEI